MPDISMCRGEGCPLKGSCYRAQAEPSEYQTYFVGVPADPMKDCNYFWPMHVYYDVLNDQLTIMYNVYKDYYTHLIYVGPL